MPIELEPTGERLIEEHYCDSPAGYAIYIMHAASYVFAETFCKGKRVLDFGCGSGYGSAKLADAAAEVFAVDVSTDAIGYAREHYSRPNLRFEAIEANGRLPLPDNSMDVITSFQVIEHVSDTSNYLSEVARVLTKDGIFILITPDRRSRLFPYQKPWNRWHLKEYDPDSLRRLITDRFDIREVLAMGAPAHIAKIETDRYRLLKWITLPFTLPGLPEAWRISGLNLLHRLRNSSTPSVAGKYIPDFGHEDIVIQPKVSQPLNIIMVSMPRP
jgi:SAM-dependent methyltransferase